MHIYILSLFTLFLKIISRIQVIFRYLEECIHMGSQIRRNSTVPSIIGLLKVENLVGNGS